ncbi:MAG: Cna B-type domain-containing protein [Clostridia bacterium]|nr:Cna B-type domain-containing protein [Clostridia bacterium]
MHRKIITLCMTVLLILSCSLTSFAQDHNSKKTGSISVTLTEQYDKEPIIGAELSVYYVATVHIDANGTSSYAYTDAFESSGIELDDPSLAVKLDAYVSEQNVQATKITTDQNGTATCEDLSLGLYFIRQTGTVDGFAPCTPFMVTLPVKNAEGYVYDVNASPKTEVARLTSITVKKVWNTDASTEAAKSVTVQLLKNGTVIKTATLNAQNNWQVIYTDMPESDAYSIKEVNVPQGFTATYQKNGYVFTVTNTSTLIQTGQLTWPIPVLAIGGMLLIAFGIVLLRNKRKTNA